MRPGCYIENARIMLHQIFCELEEQNRAMTARLLQEIFFGQDKEPEAVRTRNPLRPVAAQAQDKEPEAVRTLIGTMQGHNDQCRFLVGKDYALITVRRYESCKDLSDRNTERMICRWRKSTVSWYVPLNFI